MTFSTIEALADRSALFTALRQDQLTSATDALGEHRWEADLDAGTFTFRSAADPDRTLVAVAHLIASIAPGPRSLRWAWALPQGDRTGVAGRLRAYGAEHGVAALISDEVPFPSAEDAEGLTDRVADAVAGAAVEITGLSPAYTATVGGTRAVLLLDAPVEALTVATAVGVLPRILASRPLRDARASVWDLARLAGWHLRWSDDAFTGATVSDATGSADFRFDEHARVSGIAGRLTGA